MMPILAVASGFALVIIIVWDMVESVVLPRTVTGQLRLARLFYRLTWQAWRQVARRLPWRRFRETLLGAYGPLSLPFLLVLWALGLVLGFALVQWGLGSQVISHLGPPTFAVDLYLSGVTFLTLGFGDVVPATTLSRWLAVAEAGVGFGFLAIVIGYLPVLYQSFSRREVGISLLDSRAGSPPSGVELLRRYGEGHQMEALVQLLADFERWAAELLESHLSYPVLAFYRSQHDRESWLAALTAILDACALVKLGFADHPPWEEKLLWQAQHTFAMARHAAVDLALVFNTPPSPQVPERLSLEDLPRMRASLAAAGIRLADGTDEKLWELRCQYEPYVSALGNRLYLALPPWMMEEGAKDNWQTSAWKEGGHF